MGRGGNGLEGDMEKQDAHDGEGMHTDWMHLCAIGTITKCGDVLPVVCPVILTLIKLAVEVETTMWVTATISAVAH